MRVSVSSNARDLRRELTEFARRKLPFAISAAINETMADVEKWTARQILRVFDRPTPWTRRAFRRRMSSPRTLAGHIFAMDRQAFYLTYQESGGDRQPKSQANVFPVEAPLNAYGNLKNRYVGRAIRRKKTFSGTPFSGKAPRSGQPAGVWERIGGKKNPRLRLLVGWTGAASYKPRFNWQEGAFKAAHKSFPERLAKAMERELINGRSRRR